MVWRGRDGAPFPLSLPNPTKNKGGRAGEQGKVGFHQKPPKSIKKSFQIIIGFAPRRFGVFCAHTQGRRIEFPLFPRTPALSRASQVALFGGAKQPSQPTRTPEEIQAAASYARRPLSPPGVRVGWLGCFAPPKRATWEARIRTGIRPADPGCVRFYPEPSRRKRYSVLE